MTKVRVRLDHGVWKASFFIDGQYVGNLMLNDKQYVKFINVLTHPEVIVENQAKGVKA